MFRVFGIGHDAKRLAKIFLMNAPDAIRPISYTIVALDHNCRLRAERAVIGPSHRQTDGCSRSHGNKLHERLTIKTRNPRLHDMR